MRNGAAYELPTSAHPIDAKGYSSLLLPSPVAQPSGNPPEVHLRKKPGRKRVTDLAIIVENGLLESGGKLLPTPSATDGTKGGPNQRGSSGDLMLPSLDL
jgi:DNA (cytosine-5)-methyltransferase 1